MKLSLFLLGLVAMSCTVQVARAQIMCTVCEFIVGEVEKYLETNSTDYEILGELVKACDLLTDPSWISMCKTFVDQEGPKLISHIIAGEPPATVCSYVDLCNSSAAFAHPPKVVSAAKAKSGDDVLCGVCTFIVGDVESYLDTNTSESDILSFLEKDCNILGIKSWITTCQGVVATFGPEIIKLVLDKQPADVVCSEIGLCNSSAATKAKVSAASPKITIPIAGAHVPAVPVAPLSVNGTLVCEVCEVLVNFTEKLVDSNKTETEIINALNDVCALIPIKDLSNTCSGMVAEYGKTIIDYLINEEPAAVVCNELKLCNNQSSSKQCLAPGKC